MLHYLGDSCQGFGVPRNPETNQAISDAVSFQCGVMHTYIVLINGFTFCIHTCRLDLLHSEVDHASSKQQDRLDLIHDSDKVLEDRRQELESLRQQVRQ